MTRRQAVRRATLLAIGMVMGKFDSVKAQGAHLTVNLDQWSEVRFTHRGKVIAVPVSEIFASLLETRNGGQ